MAEAPYKSTGIEISMKSNAFSFNILDVTPPGDGTVDTIDASHQGTSLVADYDPDPLKEGGELEFGIHAEPDTSVPVGVKDTFKVHYPAEAGGADTSFEGFITEDTADAPHRDNITGTITVQVTSPVQRKTV